MRIPNRLSRTRRRPRWFLTGLSRWVVAVAILGFPIVTHATVTIVAGDAQRVSQLSINLSDPASTNTGIGSLPYNNYINLTGASTAATMAGAMTSDAFTFTFTQSRSAGVKSFGQSAFTAYFTVTAPTTFSLAGTFADVNSPGNMSAISYSITISDATNSPTAGPMLFQEIQFSAQTPNQTFTLDGPLTGDGIATRTANSNLLLPGHVYEAAGSFFLGESGYSFPITAATASGNLTITFTPEPTGAIAWMALAGALLLRRRIARPL